MNDETFKPQHLYLEDYYEPMKASDKPCPFCGSKTWSCPGCDDGEENRGLVIIEML